MYIIVTLLTEPTVWIFSGWCLTWPLPPAPTFHWLFCRSHAKLASLVSAARAHRYVCDFIYPVTV